MRKRKQHQHLCLLCFTLFLFIAFFLLTISTITKAAAISPIQVRPADNIQQLINDASKFQTLILSEGTYNQSFTINKPITLLGKNPQNTIINTSTLPNQPAISITADQVNIQNLSIVNTASGIYTTGIRITAEHTLIKNCIIHHTPVGIALWTSNNTITQTRFHHCADEGIVLLSTAYSPCRFNTISHCIFTNNCDAIELQKASHNVIKNCTMTYNTHSGIDAIIADNNHNIITNCNISNNTVHGIYLAHSSNNLIASCTIQHNTDGNIIQTPNYQNTVLKSSEQTQNQIIDSNKQLSQIPPQSIMLSNIQNKIQNICLLILTALQNLLP